VRSSGGSAAPTLQPEDGDWPSVGPVVDDRWAAARADLGVAVGSLASRMRTSDARLGDRVGQQRDPALGTGTTTTSLHGAVQHNLYHAGQIALLRKFT
jgi:hypothetical protein